MAGAGGAATGADTADDDDGSEGVRAANDHDEPGPSDYHPSHHAAPRLPCWTRCDRVQMAGSRGRRRPDSTERLRGADTARHKKNDL
ncbi:hypothetical protein E2C01_066490 [Portunus trituberculatus]|uniref:Uncharacterized protein n=1 Tax=Portunus trituberculatus TaxID=210409 RepID=A0A5B7HPX5_PORTR|nr:hypothetical protein [Portunus trituberculatus]